MEEYKNSSMYLIKLIIKWKVQFIIISIIAVLLSILFSSELFIKPRYKSNAIVYPANILPFSEESKTEQLLQILQSSHIKDSIVKKFDLAAHYGIDLSAKSAQYYLTGQYQAFVSISKTEFESVKIEVTDTDPQMACDIVNEVIIQLNNKISSIHKEKSREVAELLRKQMNLKLTQLDSLNKDLQELRIRYQILDYNIQTEEVTKAYLKGLGSGASGKGFKDIDLLMRNLEEKGGEYYKAKVAYDGAILAYNRTREEYDNTLKELNKKFTYTYVISSPSVSDKKSYPVRWLVVTISLVSANAFLFLALIILNNKKKFQ